MRWWYGAVAAFLVWSWRRRPKERPPQPPGHLCDEFCSEHLDALILREAVQDAMKREWAQRTVGHNTLTEIRLADEHGHNDRPTPASLQAQGFRLHKRVPHTPTLWWMVKDLGDQRTAL